MTDIALEPASWDLRLATGEDGRVDLVPLEDAAAAAQMVRLHLQTWIGEWFLDTLHGVPYLQEVIGKGRRLIIVENVLRAQILSVPGVSSIKAFSLALDNTNRALTVRFEVGTPSGASAGSAVTV